MAGLFSKRMVTRSAAHSVFAAFYFWVWCQVWVHLAHKQQSETTCVCVTAFMSVLPFVAYKLAWKSPLAFDQQVDLLFEWWGEPFIVVWAIILYTLAYVAALDTMAMAIYVLVYGTPGVLQSLLFLY